MVTSLGAPGEAAVLQKHGQKLYQQGNFQAALEAFTEALNSRYFVDVIGCLDNRAATYTKLAQYDRALRDSKHMIKNEKHDERGYLRCAKVLLLDGKPEKALEVYAYGLKALPSNHPRRKVVEQLHNKLRDKLLTKCYDPFSVLPLEVAMMVIQHFNFKQIVAILRVSKKWDQFLSSMRNLWMRIDLSDARNKIHWSSVRSYIRRSKAMLTHATVKNLSTPSVQKVLEFFSRCPNLEHLEIWAPFKYNHLYDLFKGSRRLKTIIISADMVVPQDIIANFLSNLPLLERIEIHSATKPSNLPRVEWPEKLPNLRSITLGAIEKTASSPGQSSALEIPGLQNRQLSSMFPNLEELRLDWNPAVFTPYRLLFDPVELPQLRRLDLNGVYVGGEFGLPLSLEYLRIRGGTGLVGGIAGNREFPFSNELPFELPNLHTLILSDVPWATAFTIGAFLELAALPLKVIHLDSCFRITGTEIADFIRNDKFNQLAEFNLSHIAGIDDKVTEVIAKELPDLKAIDLSYTNITGCSIKTFVDARASGDNLAKVERIYAKGCGQLSSDAVAYGRANSVEIFT